MPQGSTKHKLAFKGATIMTDITRYTAADLPLLMKRINEYSIGMDEWFKRFDTAYESHTNYPPYNLVKESSVNFRLEIALAGYKKEDIEVTTEWNKLFVEAKKVGDTDDEYLHQGLAKRAFTRTWTLSDDVEVKDVSFDDGLLTIKLNRVIPEHQKKKVYELK
jgi:molecular chaperone IbpA